MTSISPRTAIDVASGVPMYRQVERSLTARIEAGEWQPGDRLPSEEELGNEYDVSRVTIRQALARIVDRGLVSREQGRGTFVKDMNLIAGARGVTSFTNEIAALGLVAGSRVLSSTVGDAGDEAIGAALGLAPADPVLVLKRLRTGSDLPIGVQTSYLPLTRFPGLEDVDMNGQSLYGVLRERYGVVATQTAETFRVGGVPADLASVLDVPADTHAFLVERVSFDVHGPFELVHSVMRGDHYQVRLVMNDTHPA